MTAVPKPTFGDRGFTAPTEAEILAGVLTDLDADLGGNLNVTNLTTPQGQIASTETAIIGDNYATFLWFVNQFDPMFSSGRQQDALGRIYFMQRIAGAPTVVQATCVGLAGVVIPVGALARAQDDNLYVCQQQGVIDNGGSVILPFACAINGPVPCVADSDNWEIYQAVFGWDSLATVEDGVLGRATETRGEFEARRAASVALNAVGILDSILASVLAVPDVLDAYVAENDQPTIVPVGGVTLGPNSIYICVLGGNVQAVGEAIWRHKAPGCGYNGNTAVTVLDPSPEYSPPVPSYSVLYQVPETINFAVLVVLKGNSSIPADAEARIAAAIIQAFAGVDGGPRAKIGSTVFASRYYSTVALLGAWAQIVDIQIGRAGDGAVFTGQITGTVLTVTSVSLGALAVGQLIQGGGHDVKGTILALGTGTGGNGTYTISVSQTVASETMNATNLVNDVILDIDEAPAISADTIHLVTV